MYDTSDIESFNTYNNRYLRLLAEKYPTIQDVCTEIINCEALLNLPKGTEHFMSDLHGEYEAFFHILNNCSGVIKEKVELLFSDSLSSEEISNLCTLIYYPADKIKLIKKTGRATPDWYVFTLRHLIELAKYLSSKYTRAKVRSAMPEPYVNIMDELLHAQPDEDNNQVRYHNKIIETLIRLNNGDDFIEALAALIKKLSVDRLHIVGDIFDRGARPDSIMDMLMDYHSIDIEWGNHDILWMGAAAGSEACVATVVRNSISYNNMDVLEKGYGISLRPLTIFAEHTYPEYENLVEASRTAISIILFKLEGHIINRHPDYGLDKRILISKINHKNKTVEIDGKDYELNNIPLTTIDPDNPLELTPEEREVIDGLVSAFKESERLHRHIRFLYDKGSIYKVYNGNLLYHGCIPLDDDGNFNRVAFDGKTYWGKYYMDYADHTARQAYVKGERSALDFMWYLWTGNKSPLCGRIIKTFERMMVKDTSTWEEPQDNYYTHYNNEAVCSMILREFGLFEASSHIINGHTPVKVIKGQSPIKGNGKLIIIDGGFCRAYQKTTGIAGYTLIFNSHGIRLMSHHPFKSRRSAIIENKDILSVSERIETINHRVMVSDIDSGKKIRRTISDLTELLAAYRSGAIVPKFV
ncbi:MAG: fructose-1,6-bisphosphatase [Clostridiales bacterium]|nr:fructose-1,6-bisphosphatase [Clostridiales bacterium]